MDINTQNRYNEDPMITEDYVSFEIAKLLKEKGFDIPCDNYYDSSGKTPNESVYGGANIETLDYNADPFVKSGFHKFKTFSAPTQAMAMKWLRDEKNLCIEPYRTACGYLSTISKIPTGSELYAQEYEGDDEDSGQFTTYEKSCEAAIKYCLEKLI